MLGVASVLCFSATPCLAVDREDDDEPKAWSEVNIELPASSRPVRPIRLDLGLTTDNVFSVDAKSLKVGSDGVVRFLLSVLSPAGAVNVTFEGIRCATREHRVYAFGRPDGSWSSARNPRWLKVEQKFTNGHAYTLFREYFCPNGIVVRGSENAVEALERGGHPDFKRQY